MMNTIRKEDISTLILNSIINKAGCFNNNDLYTLSWEKNCAYEFLKKVLNSLVRKGQVKKRYFNPIENYSADEPIGQDSYEVFVVKKDIDTNEFMQE